MWEWAVYPLAPPFLAALASLQGVPTLVLDTSLLSPCALSSPSLPDPTPFSSQRTTPLPKDTGKPGTRGAPQRSQPRGTGRLSLATRTWGKRDSHQGKLLLGWSPDHPAPQAWCASFLSRFRYW